MGAQSLHIHEDQDTLIQQSHTQIARANTGGQRGLLTTPKILSKQDRDTIIGFPTQNRKVLSFVVSSDFYTD